LFAYAGTEESVQHEAPFAQQLAAAAEALRRLPACKPGTCGAAATAAANRILGSLNAAGEWAFDKVGPRSSPLLESMIWDIAEKFLVPSAAGPPRAAGGAIRRILHVGSAYYETGGHGRWVSSFVHQQAVKRECVLFLTHMASVGNSPTAAANRQPLPGYLQDVPSDG
jgi:hypothetical protein